VIGERIRRVLAAPLTCDDVVDPDRELARVLATVGLTAALAGGSVTFAGKDPILKSPWPLATMGGVALMAKAVAVENLWRFRTGEGRICRCTYGGCRTGCARSKTRSGSCSTATRRERRETRRTRSCRPTCIPPGTDGGYSC
jgi:hypothetical protein